MTNTIYLGDWKCWSDVITAFENITEMHEGELQHEECPYLPGEDGLSGAGHSYRCDSWRKRKKQLTAALALPQYVGLDVLLAGYWYEDYNGEAFVLYRKDGVLYEVNAGHCSCYGIEDQWEPEETTKEALLHRLRQGNLGTKYGEGNRFAVELTELLTKMED